MAVHLFGVNNARKEYEQFVSFWAQSNGMLEAVDLDDSSHMDQSDMGFMCPNELEMQNGMMGGAKHATKPQGANHEFHEYLGMLMLDFCHRVGLNNGAINVEGTQKRIKQF